MTISPTLQNAYLLDPAIHFLNHGSFGATPRPVFDAYQNWQRRLEHQPVQFLGVELGSLLAESRQALADYLHTSADNLVYIPNATYGVNVIARSLPLEPDDEVLTTNHEYGACNNAWQFLSRKQGFRYIQQPIAMPITSAETIVEQLWQGVTPRTKLIYLSHITSATALRLPVEAICARARAAGILTLVDGAHAPGQIVLHLPEIGADFYTGNCHKWLSAPKGAAFLYARPEVQHLVEPLIVSWGWGENRTLSFGSDFLDYLQWTGTYDPAAALSVPAAIQFQQIHNWTAVQNRCHTLLQQTLDRIHALTDLPPMYPPNAGFYRQMAIFALPPIADLPAYKQQLYTNYRIEIPVIAWENWQFLRISVQAYNTQSDMDALVTALQETL
jgi:isopenicillin-N epimerase